MIVTQQTYITFTKAPFHISNDRNCFSDCYVNIILNDKNAILVWMEG